MQRDQKVCSISFDAAWGADNTQKILDVLSEYGVTCTFFVVGNWADQYPEQAKAIVESGNELMNHSNAHDHFNALSADAIIADVNTCNDKIEALTGVRPTLIRCPFGEYDDHVISAVNSMGMTAIQWDVDSLDWKDYDAKTIFKRVTENLQPGSIVLFHNAALHTPEALPSISGEPVKVVVVIGVIHHLHSRIPQGLHGFRVFIHPVPHHEKSSLHVILRQNVDQMLGILVAPRGVKGDSAQLLLPSLGMEPIQWDVDSLDWKDYDADTIYQR